MADTATPGYEQGFQDGFLLAAKLIEEHPGVSISAQLAGKLTPAVAADYAKGALEALTASPAVAAEESAPVAAESTETPDSALSAPGVSSDDTSTGGPVEPAPASAPSTAKPKRAKATPATA